jgi:hypothetical protein
MRSLRRSISGNEIEYQKSAAPIATRIVHKTAIFKAQTIVKVPCENIVINANKNNGRPAINSNSTKCPTMDELPHLINLFCSKDISYGHPLCVGRAAPMAPPITAPYVPPVKVPTATASAPPVLLSSKISPGAAPASAVSTSGNPIMFATTAVPIIANVSNPTAAPFFMFDC